MYHLRNLFDQHPNQIAGALFAWVNVVVCSGAIDISVKTLSAANVALVATLLLFVSAKTTNTSALEEAKFNGEEESLKAIALGKQLATQQNVVVPHLPHDVVPS